MTQYDILIAGGGVMGSAIAYNLIKRNPNLKIAMIEKDSTYDHSSTVRSDGNTRIQFNLEPNIRISQYGLEMLARFSEEMAVEGQAPINTNFRQQGNIFVMDEKGEAYARTGMAKQKELGCEIEWLTPQQIQEVYPLFNPDSCVGATLGRQDGTMSPLDVLRGYRRKAVSLGVTVLEDSVTELTAANGSMTGLTLASGQQLHAPAIVNAAGVWCNALYNSVGVTLPITSIRRQVYSVAIDQSFDSVLPMLLLPTGQYLLHEGGNHFVTGGAQPTDRATFDDSGWSKSDFEENLWEGLIHFLPAFDRLKVLNGWAGLYAVNDFDGNAILGEWPEIKGLYMVNGFSGHGFQQCHGVGRYLAECILQDTPAIDLSIFSPQRILDNAPVYENPARLI